eukprot:gene21937-28983_t
MALSVRSTIASRSAVKSVARPSVLSVPSRAGVLARASDKVQLIQPINGDPFVGSFETPVTSAPIVAAYLSNLPAYRTGVAPLLRGVEIGLAHGFLMTAEVDVYKGLKKPSQSQQHAAEVDVYKGLKKPSQSQQHAAEVDVYKGLKKPSQSQQHAAELGPLRNVEGTAEVAGCLAAAGLIIILGVCLSMYGAAQFQSTPAIGVKTLSGRSIARDPLQSSKGWNEFTAGHTLGGLSGAGFAYILTQVLPYYS